MQAKDLMAASLLLVATCGGIIASCISQAARSLLFVALLVSAVFVDRLDVEFGSLYWYRGSTRGFELTLLDALALSVLLGSLLVPRTRLPRWYWPAGVGLMVLFALYALASVLTAEPAITGLFELSKIVRGLIVFAAAAAYVRSDRELGEMAFALATAVVIQAIFGLKQRYIGGMDRVAGTVDHANSLSMYLCLVTPVIAAAALADFPRWLRSWCWCAVGGGALALLLTVSRAGIPIFVVTVGGVVLWGMTWRVTAKKLGWIALVAVAGAVVVRQSWDNIVERYEQATLEQEYFDKGTEGRGVYLRWAKAILDEHPYGVGLNNWSYWVSREYGAREGYYYEDYGDFSNPPPRESGDPGFHAAPAHNLFALTAGELGYAGAILFVLMWLRWLQLGSMFLWRRLTWPTHRLGAGIFFGTCGIFFQSMTEWVYRQTPIYFTFAVLLGTLASLTWTRRHVAPAFDVGTAREEEMEEAPEPAAAGRW